MEPNQNQEKQVAQQPTPIPDKPCRKCDTLLLESYYFCPNCGIKIKESPFKFSVTSFMGNMLLSILLPPLGIYPGIKHLKKTNKTAKILGILYIVLTILVGILMIKFTIDYVNNMNKALNDFYLQQNLYL